MVITSVLTVVLGKFIDSLSYSRAKFLTTDNFSTFIPSRNKGAIILYYSQSAGGVMSGLAYDMAISNFIETNSTLNFYRVEGPYSPEIIANEVDIEKYPSLAFYQQNSAEVTSLYPGTWGVLNIVGWLNDLPAKSYIFGKERTRCKCGSVIDAYNSLGDEIQMLNEKLKDILNVNINEHNWVIEILSLLFGICVGYSIYILIRRKQLNQKIK